MTSHDVIGQHNLLVYAQDFVSTLQRNIFLLVRCASQTRLKICDAQWRPLHLRTCPPSGEWAEFGGCERSGEWAEFGGCERMGLGAGQSIGREGW